MKNFIRRCVAATIISQLAISAFAQSWNLVWQEDFGVVPDSVFGDFADPSKTMPGHKLSEQWGVVEDGYYTIVSKVYRGDPGINNLKETGAWGHGSWWYPLKQDHTGNKNGGMLLCNTDGTLEGEIIYRQSIDFPICSTNKYKFVMYAGGSTNFGGILPSFEMMVVGINGNDSTLLANKLTGGVPMLYEGYDWSGDPNWSKYEVEFDPSNYSSVEFQLINRAKCTADGSEPQTEWNTDCQCNKIKCGSGNDFVLDDIQLFRQDAETVPDPDITNSSLVEETSLNGCLYSSSYSIPTKVLEEWHNLYRHIYFLWQESEDGYKWTDLPEPMSGIDKTKAILEVDITKSMQYRVIITGADESEAKAKEIAGQISENGGPDDGCYLFSISNTLSAALPKPDCQYRDDLKVVWSEDFGVCDSLESRESECIPFTFNKKCTTYGEYAVVAHPDKALDFQMCQWEAGFLKNFKQKSGDAFALIRMKKEDQAANPVFFKKTIEIPVCACKAYMFNMTLMADRGSYETNMMVKLSVLDKSNNEVGVNSTHLQFKSAKATKGIASVPFDLPKGYTGPITLVAEVDFDAKVGSNNATSDWLNFGIDDINITVCGETMPEASINIDGTDVVLLSGFDCSDETPHLINIVGIENWKDQYPNAAFIWQTSIDGGGTWENLSATTTSIAYEGEPEILYRVVIGESSAVAEEVARNGKPADGCSIFYITNKVGFKCKESGCRAPKFSLDSEEKVMTIDSVFCDTPDAIDIEVFQTNRVNVDDFYIAKKGTDNSYGVASVLTPAPTSTDGKWILSLEKKSGEYMIYAMNDTCKSDTFYVNIDLREKLELKPIDDQMFCATEKPKIEIKSINDAAKAVYMKSGPLEGYAEFILMATTVEFTDDAKTIGNKEFTAWAVDADEKCKSEEITFKLDYEDIPVFTLSSDAPKVCKGEKAELKLNITPTHNSENHTYEILGSDDNTVDVDDLVVFPTQLTTYTATATSEVCNTNKTETVTIDVDLPQTIDLTTVPSPELQTSLEGNIVCAPANVSFTVSGDNLTSWDWEYRKKGESDFSKWEAGSTSTSNSIEITEETSFRVSSPVASANICNRAFSEIITIKAEKKPDFTLALDNERVCESGAVELSLVTSETYDASQITATANGSPISLINNKYSTIISEDTKFEVIVAGLVCGQTPFDTTAYVDHSLSFTMIPDKTKICEGESVEFTITGSSDGIVWYKSTDDRNYSEFTPTSGNKITPDETIYVYAGTPSDGACEAFKVEPVKIEVEKALSFDLVSDVTGKICAGSPVNLSVKNLLGTPKTSKWEKNGIEVTASSSYNDSPVSTSLYKLTLNADVCPSVDHEVKIEVESADALSLTADKNLICEGESVTLTKDYGTNDPSLVTWWAEVDGIKTKITESTTVTPVKSTSYYLSVKGIVCNEVYSLPAIVDVEPKIDFELTTDVNGIICEGKEANISLNLISGRPNNVIFTANGNPDPFDIVKKNIYNVKPSEDTKYELTLAGIACTSSVTKNVEVNIQKQPKLSVSIDKTAVCEGDDVTVTPTAENVDDLEWKVSLDGENYTDLIKSTSSQVFNPSQSVMYMIKTLSDDACEGMTWKQKVEVEPAFSVSFDANSAIVCPGVDVEVKANVVGMSNNLKFEWKKTTDGTNFKTVSSTTDPTIVKTKLDATTDFLLTVSGEYCPEQPASTTVSIDAVPTMTLEATNDSLCEGDEITLTSKYTSNNFDESSIVMKNGDDELVSGQQAAILSPTESMEVNVTAMTPAGCVIKPSSIKLFVDPAISVEVPDDTTLCEGGEVKLSVNGNNGYTYAWSIDGDVKSQIYKFAYDGDESVNVKLDVKSKVCVETYNIGINVVPTPRIVSVEESGANTFEFVAEGGSGIYQFDFGNGFQSSSILNPATYGRTYKIKVKDELGCTSDTSIVTPTYELEVPTSFTPNGDGIDDVWHVKNLDKYPSASIRLYDRYGKKLCDMTSAEMEAWDGSYRGKELPSTDYWYEIEIDEIDKTYVGHFTLIRGKD